MKPPNLKTIEIPCCCGNCNHWNPELWSNINRCFITWCRLYQYETKENEVCDWAWKKIGEKTNEL